MNERKGTETLLPSRVGDSGIAKEKMSCRSSGGRVGAGDIVRETVSEMGERWKRFL